MTLHTDEVIKVKDEIIQIEVFGPVAPVQPFASDDEAIEMANGVRFQPSLEGTLSLGRTNAFFLGGGQIDGEGNINLVSIGDYHKPKARFPGSFGSSYLYFVVPKVILFRTEHSKRTLVPKVSFISAPGGSDAFLLDGSCICLPAS